MATIKRQPQRPPETIDRFLGLNEDTSGDTELQLGESPNMINFRITENYKLRKREGYVQLFASLGAFTIRGMWYGKINGTTYFLFTANGNVYSHNLSTGSNTSIGILTDAETYFFSFGGKVYMLNGSEYKSWDGTTFGDVAGYIPLIATATPPAGGGSPNEQINLLTGKKYQRFSADGTATVYQCAETNLASVDQVYVNGTLKASTDYTVDLAAGKVTFGTAPIAGTDNVDIYWTKNNNDRTAITGNYYAMFFGGKNDTRVFFYGDGSNQYYFTGLANGVPSAEYIPSLNYREISSSQYQITDIIRQYDRQIIYTNGGEAWYSYYDTFYDSNNNIIVDFPTFPLNNTIGNVAVGQGQLIQNNPFTLFKGVQEWVSTNVRDERNAVYKSKRIQPSLDALDLSKAITVDWEKRWEYWISIGKEIYIYNYRLDVWYKFQVNDTITTFLIAEDVMYFGINNGQIMRFDRAELDDNGTAIATTWEMNFYDFNAEWLQKFINEMWISMKPESRASVDLTFQTNRKSSSNTFKAVYNLATFKSTNFASFSFLTNYNPQPFRFKIKAKKFVYFKLVLTNSALDEKVTILSINLPARYGSKSR
jgi:hypothetical protein